MASLPCPWAGSWTAGGPRLTIGLGGLLFGLGTFLGSAISALWHLYALYGGLAAMGMGAAWAPLVSTISRWFVKRRGLAIGIGSLGGGTGTFFLAPLVSHLILTYGWRRAYAFCGLLATVLIVGAAMLMWRDPQSKGALPYGATAPAAAAPLTPATGLSLALAIRHRAFWLLVAVFGLWWCGGSIVYVQLAPFLLEKGQGLRLAALAVTLFGAGNGLGKMLVGWLGDRLGPRPTFAATTLLALLAMAALVPARHPALLLGLSGLFGFGYGGGTPQITTLIVECFGLRAVGTITGALMAFVGALGALGPLLSGLLADATGSYAPAYLLGAAILLGAVLATAPLSPTPAAASHATPSSPQVAGEA
ncbi:MAG: hypothetical protein KatS3mg131_2774 [Candidatus Tectimicrobiota bacterium]|nr:MAG: hypothetical protein KatS3mg131_2774 [Candidatus Tectomicrobia bacterium]